MPSPRTGGARRGESSETAGNAVGPDGRWPSSASARSSRNAARTRTTTTNGSTSTSTSGYRGIRANTVQLKITNPFLTHLIIQCHVENLVPMLRVGTPSSTLRVGGPGGPWSGRGATRAAFSLGENDDMIIIHIGRYRDEIGSGLAGARDPYEHEAPASASSGPSPTPRASRRFIAAVAILCLQETSMTTLSRPASSLIQSQRPSPCRIDSSPRPRLSRRGYTMPCAGRGCPRWCVGLVTRRRVRNPSVDRSSVSPGPWRGSWPGAHPPTVSSSTSGNRQACSTFTR
jgi:hypothetical protein